MDILKKIETKAEAAAKLLVFDLIYLSGEEEVDDRFRAENKDLAIYCYGSSEESAVASARKEAVAKLVKNPGLVEKILKQL